MKILWDLKCPIHDIPLIAHNDIFAKCPKCNCSFIQEEVRNPYRRQKLREKMLNEEVV